MKKGFKKGGNILQRSSWWGELKYLIIVGYEGLYSIQWTEMKKNAFFVPWARTENKGLNFSKNSVKKEKVLGNWIKTWSTDTWFLLSTDSNINKEYSISIIENE